MATINKDFRVKHGLVVEGTTATVNGEDILTAASTTTDLAEGTNLYFTEQRAVDAVADEINTAVTNAVDALDTDDIEEGATNKYFTDSRALTATASAYDAAGAASAAQTAAETYADGLAVNYDVAGAAAAAQTAAELYADGLAGNYDAAGAAASALTSANTYTDTALEDYTTTSGLDAAVDGLGYLKSADLSGLATETFVGTAVENAVDALVDGAPGLLDTLNEIAAAIADDENYATTMTTALAGKQNALTAGTGIDITGDTISVDANTYDAYGAAATAEQNAKDYADTNFVNVADLPGQLDDYVPVADKGVANGVATLDANGKVPASQLDIDVTGDINTAINALDTDDIEEGSSNLYFTNSRAVDALQAVVPNFIAVDVNSVARQVASTVTASAAGTVNVIAFGTGNQTTNFGQAIGTSAEFLIKVASGTHTEISKVLVTIDTSYNVAITEYGVVGTNGSLATISATYSEFYGVTVTATVAGAATISAVGTVIA